MAHIPFDLSAILRSAVELGRVLGDNLPRVEAIDTPREWVMGSPDGDAIETAHIRLILALLPYSDPERIDLLIRDLTIPPDLPEKGPLSPEQYERMEAGARLLRDCECGAESRQAGQALHELALLLMEWPHGVDAREWLAKLGKVTRQIWDALPDSEQQKLLPVLRAASHLWEWRDGTASLEEQCILG